MRSIRAMCNVVGIGKRKTGTSKNGFSYDKVPVSLTYPDPTVNGLNAVTLNIDGPAFDAAGLYVGDTREIIMAEERFQLQFVAAL